MKSIGIDIGSSSLKIAEVISSGKDVTITQVLHYPLTSKSDSDREIELVTTLKEALKVYKNEERIKFTLGLPQDRVSLRTLHFPFKEKYKILKSLPFEMEDLTPFLLEDTLYDAKVISKDSVGADVMGLAVSKDFVKKQLSFCRDCGFDPDIVSAEGFGLNNLFEDIHKKIEQNNSSLNSLKSEDTESEDKDGDESSSSKNTNIKIIKDFSPAEAILNIGHSSTLLIVRSKKTLKSVRRINWGAKFIIEALANEYNIQPKEAKALLESSKGVLLDKKGSEKDLKISEIISNEIKSLGKNIYLTLLEIKGLHALEVKGVGLLGGLSLTKNLGARLTQTIGVPCNPVSRIKEHPEISLTDSKNLTSAIAIGLALEGLRKPSNPAVNFRRGEFSKESSQLKKLWKDWNFYVKLAAASFVVFFIYAQIRATLTEDLSLEARRSMKDAAEKILGVKKTLASEQKLKSILNEMDNRESLKKKITEYSNSAPSPLKILKRISERASSRTNFPVQIDKMVLNANSVEIVGRTPKQNEVANFATRLKSLAAGQINQTSKALPSKDQKLMYQFNITFKPKNEVM